MTSMTLRELADRRNFLIGAAAVPEHLRNEPAYAETLSRHFNCLVAENCMKAQYLQPEPGVFSFTEADGLVDFAEAHGMKVRGHTLVWHTQTPLWLREADLSRIKALDVLRTHIFSVMEHFKGRVFAWDVVNEVLEDQFFSLRDKSLWYQLIGPDYVDLAFKWARQADPDCRLFYNDYNLEASEGKFMATFRYLRELLDRDIPIDGVGFQFHSAAEDVANMGKAEKFAARCARFGAELGLEVQITEMDISISPTPDQEELALQAAAYAEVLSMALKAENCTALVTWGFTDKYSWIPHFHHGRYGHALPFDENYQPKLAVDAMLRVLRSA